VWHGGSVPGLGTLVMFAPHDGVGLALLTNVDEPDAANELVIRRVFRAAFGLPENADLGAALADANDPRNEAKAAATAEEGGKPVPLPADVDFTGAYAAAGYGPGFVLCNTSSTSAHCLEILATFQSTLGDGGLNATSLVGAWPRLWSTHIWLVHQGGTRFALQTPIVFPQGYGKNESAFMFPEWTGEEGGPSAECVVEEGIVRGCGLFGMVKPKTMREKKGGSVEERAEAWFERVA
jgi:hypothetical protein